MPLDIRSQVVTALDNINKNPELYTPPKPTTSLETRINDLKETNPSKYRELSRILPTKWSNYEIGKISGGKPFTLNTYIDYSDKFYKGYFRGPYDKSWKRNYQDFKPGL